MTKLTLIALATLIGATASLPTTASAIDNGPCHYCDMEPIVVKGDRPKKKKVKSSIQQLQTGQPARAKLKIRK